MTNISAIQVLYFVGRKEEWPSWSEKVVAIATCSGTKDVLLGKIVKPSIFEVIDEKKERTSCGLLIST
jgi:hypothetical protein